MALYGPTSSGKTALSVDFGQKLRTELGIEPVVISADSRQVYVGMDVGTSKTTPAEMRGIRHEMIDVAEPARKLELEEYVSPARRHVEACLESGGLPVIVGGTSVYVRSLLEGWQVDEVASAREWLRRDFPRSMTADAYQLLVRLDRGAAKRVHPNNHDGILNALARAMAHRERDAAPAAVPRLVFGVDPPATKLDDRVGRTYDDQVRRGLYDEIALLDERYDLQDQLRRLGRDAPNQVLHTHGYAEWFEVARERGKPLGSLTKGDVAEVRERVVGRIRAHTRRQRAAFKKLPAPTMVKSAAEMFSKVAAGGPSRHFSPRA